MTKTKKKNKVTEEKAPCYHHLHLFIDLIHFFMSEYLYRKQFLSIEEAVDELKGQPAGYSIKVILQGYGHNKAIIAQMLAAGVKVSVEAYPDLRGKPGIWTYDVTVIK